MSIDTGPSPSVGPADRMEPARPIRVASKVGHASLVHPLLFAGFPVLFLWAQNLDQEVRPATALVLMAITTAGTDVVVGIAYAILRNLTRAALVGSIAIISFCTFGRVAAGRVQPLSSRETALLILWLVVTGAAMVLVAVSRRPERLTTSLNAIAAVLVFMNVIPIALHRPPGVLPTVAWPLDASRLDPAAAGPPRDVYYLIFDRYANERTLSDLYGYDNTPFLDGLRSRGFLVNDGALANYPQTIHSLASSLNMTYLDDLAANVGTDSSDWEPLRRSLDDTTASRTFQAMGYQYLHVGSWWGPTWADPTADKNYTYGGYDEFSGVFATTTMWPAIAGRFHIGASPDIWRQQWERVHFQVATLDAIARDPASTFTFAHFTLPHPPYVFNADGSYKADHTASEDAYRQQLEYTNTVIDQIVGDLLSQPGSAPIIMLQSDEGPHPPDQDEGTDLTWPWSQQSDVELGRNLRIFQAFYVPDVSDRRRYEHTTPVNSFRLILDDFFGADLPLLANRSFVFTDYEHPYRFEDVTDRLR